ncbi:hypothetical protein DBR32_01740 [Taibaiella sp. KBW10]|uniref:thermonuclease family protein n=1 Tax=Taibaiella sp. KBW10 TaxID=2153357 RepID=UPI000F5AF0FB|nr:thermonuclease family protein [Taibaiella sp. KBW10]RQO32353.1 hypothetical protein DBR32_01740 [Taibaiella sp. KBW10]
MFSRYTALCATKNKQALPALQVNKTYSGRSVSVADGDTFTLLTEDKVSYNIRLEGIDAPEKGMPYYKVSKKYLAQLLLEKKLECMVKKVDQYGRYVGRIYYIENGRSLDVSKEMLRAGLAWHYKQYNKETDLSALEIEARQLKKGLWVETKPIAPWMVRKYRRAGISDARFRQLQQENSPFIAPYLAP